MTNGGAVYGKKFKKYRHTLCAIVNTRKRVFAGTFKKPYKTGFIFISKSLAMKKKKEIKTIKLSMSHILLFFFFFIFVIHADSVKLQVRFLSPELLIRVRWVIFYNVWHNHQPPEHATTTAQDIISTGTEFRPCY